MRTPNTGNCLTCGGSLAGKRPDAKYCSAHCYDTRLEKTKTKDRSRTCPQCGTNFAVAPTHNDANRKYCSRQCARRASEKKISGWKNFHPAYMQEYNRNRLVKNPGAWRNKYRQERNEALEMLGGKCVVCGVTNPNWLHIDYIPTTRGKPSRHSRHVKFIREHIADFRILCANHHYELTLTGSIEGSEIRQ